MGFGGDESLEKESSKQVNQHESKLVNADEYAQARYIPKIALLTHVATA